MKYISRIPKFSVSIIRPNYATADSYTETSIATFGPASGDDALIGYEYGMGIESFDAPFSLTFKPAYIGNTSDTVYDLVALNDLVKISEFDEEKYMGVVGNIRYAASMSDSPDRTIIITGYGIGGILDRFSMLLDQVLLADAATPIEALDNKVKTLIADMSGSHTANASMGDIFNTIKTSFSEAMVKIGRFTSGTGIMKVIDHYISFADDAKDLTTKWPIAISIFSYGSISLGQAWKDLVYKPFYEFFPKWDSVNGKWLLHLRLTPFDPLQWVSLPHKSIDPLCVRDVDIGLSADETKTWFFAYLAGGSMSYEIARATYQGGMCYAPDKWALYGYRPLEASFKYVDREALVDKTGKINLASSDFYGGLTGAISDASLMSEYSQKLCDWYQHGDEMLSGTIAVMSTVDTPKIGTRARYLGCEFYVESISSSWQYGGPMVSSLRVTRGGVYSEYSSDTWDGAWFTKAKHIGSKLEMKESS
jgi:hypothetical protein